LGGGRLEGLIAADRRRCNMGLLKRPVVLAWLVMSFIVMVVSILLSIFVPSNMLVAVIAVLLSQASSSIFFPILVGYFYDKVTEEESGGAIWRVFKEFSDGGIIRVYKDREESARPENAVVELRHAFLTHRQGEVKLVGVSLRVFFNATGPFYEAISKTAQIGETNKEVQVQAPISHPESPEVTNRAAIETPNVRDSLIRRDITLTAANIEHLQSRFPNALVQYGYYSEAPYCTLVVFPDRCFFSPNLLSRVVPVRLPMMRIPVKSSTSSGHVVHQSERSDASVNIIQSSGRHGQGGAGLAPGLSLEIEPVSIVDQAVQDGVPDGWIGEAGVPFWNRHLSGDHCGGSAIAIIQDFEQVLGLCASQGITQPVVEDQESHSGEGVEEFGVGAIGVGEGGLVKETRGALIANGKVVAAGGVGEGASQEGFADASRAQDEDVQVSADPFTLGKLEDETAVDAA